MHKKNTLSWMMLWLASTIAPSGCTIEEVPVGFIKVTGRVAYEGQPVKKGTINFIPVHDGGVAASGEIDNGVIKNVMTRNPGDGVGQGRYKVTIIAFDQTDPDRRWDRFNGPNRDEVASLVANAKVLIPLKYSSVTSSDLTADVSPNNRNFEFELKD
jgi:hypothetical protein